MIKETVSAVGVTHIVTESGSKTLLGNREFVIGDEVWTDGNYAFGTMRAVSSPIIPIGEMVPAAYGFFIWQGIDGGPTFRFYNAKTLQYTSFKNYSIWGGKFIYNSSGTKCAWICFNVADKIIKTVVLTADGFSSFLVTLPVDHSGTSISSDGYVDDLGDIYWAVYVDTTTYSKYYTASGVVQEATGSVNILKYKNNELIQNCDFTEKVIVANNETFAAAVALVNAATLEYSEINNYSPSNLPPDIGGIPTYWQLVQTEEFHIRTQAYCPVKIKSLNLPEGTGFHTNFISYGLGDDLAKVGLETMAGNNVWAESNMTYNSTTYELTGELWDPPLTQIDCMPRNLYEGQNMQYYGPCIVGSVIASSSFRIDENMKKVEYGTSKRATPLSPGITVNQETFFAKIAESEFGGFFQSDEVITIASTNQSTYGSPPIYLNAGGGYTFEYRIGYGDQNGYYPAYFKLTKEAWEIDITEWCQSYASPSDASRVTILDDNHILFLDPAHRKIGAIDLTTKVITELVSNVTFSNCRMPKISSTNLAKLAELLKIQYEGE